MSFERFPRRDFLRWTALLSGIPFLKDTQAQEASEETARPKVIHVHHGRAARWPRTAGFYRNYVDANVVRMMLDQAVQTLKSGSVEQAWKAVFALTSNATRVLGIKLNCNNSSIPDGAGNEIDAIPEPVLAVIAGFIKAGGRPENVKVYDLTTSDGGRYIGQWFRNRIAASYPTVKICDQGVPTSGLWNAKTHVTWSSGYGTKPPDIRINDLVLQADYLVNVPLVKRHIGAGITLGYKNHFGSIDNCGKLHNYVYSDTTNASVLADIMGSPMYTGLKTIAKKTVLTVGDLLYGQPCKNYGLQPTPWTLFGKEWPNCLIVSDDPVAADSVMSDLLEGEPPGGSDCGDLASWRRRYLTFAEKKGQGIHEHVALTPGRRFDPALMTYSRIDYRFLDLCAGGADLKIRRVGSNTVRLEWTHYFSGNCEVWRATRRDFKDGIKLGTTRNGWWEDSGAPSTAYYRVDYIG